MNSQSETNAALGFTTACGAGEKAVAAAATADSNLEADLAKSRQKAAKAAKDLKVRTRGS
jgi:hypothetical protein